MAKKKAATMERAETVTARRTKWLKKTAELGCRWVQISQRRMGSWVRKMPNDNLNLFVIK